jgi:hypothetical protein
MGFSLLLCLGLLYLFHARMVSSFYAYGTLRLEYLQIVYCTEPSFRNIILYYVIMVAAYTWRTLVTAILPAASMCWTARHVCGLIEFLIYVAGTLAYSVKVPHKLPMFPVRTLRYFDCCLVCGGHPRMPRIIVILGCGGHPRIMWILLPGYCWTRG